MNSLRIIRSLAVLFVLGLLSSCPSPSPEPSRQVGVIEDAESTKTFSKKYGPYDNCGVGQASHTTITRSFEQFVDGEGSLKLAAGVVEASLGTKYGERTGVSVSHTMTSGPNTKTLFVLEWTDQESSGRLLAGSNFARYTVRVPLSVKQVSAKDEGCPIVEAPQCVWTRAISEESGTDGSLCPSGFAVKGVHCDHDYCDNMSLQCCPYSSELDNEARGQWSDYFSEEDGQDGITSSKGFVAGLRCRHDYCDTLGLYFIASPNLINDDQCYFTEPVSEEIEISSGFCRDGWFVAGMSCFHDYCDNVSLYCCRARPGVSMLPR